MAQWTLLVILIALIEVISSQYASDQSDEYPLAKSLGYAIRNRFGKVEDARISQEFMEKNKELRKASQESFENFRHRRVADDGLDIMREESVKNRRRGSKKLQSVAGRRRERTQALRRDKLTHQSLRSHVHHSKMTNLDYGND